MANANTTTKVVSGNANKYNAGDHSGLVRFSYVNVWTPKASLNGGDPKYSVSILIPKNDTKTINACKAAIASAIHIGISAKWNGQDASKLPTFHNPLRDGDLERPEDEVYKGCYFINATCKTAPGIIGPDYNPIMNQSDFYSGCYGFFSVNFYAYNNSGSRGIACGLNNLQKMEDGDPLGGRVSAESDFGGDSGIDDQF